VRKIYKSLGKPLYDKVFILFTGRRWRISRKERIKNVTIRQQIGLEETITREIEQYRLTWYGHVQRMAEGRLPKIAPKWMPKQKKEKKKKKKKN
jgi:hypothetical protein